MTAPYPKPAPWEERGSAVVAMTGGNDGYLDSLRKICEIVEDRHPSSSELVEEMSKCLSVTQKAAGGKESFLRKAGVIQVEDGLCLIGQATREWFEADRADILIAVLHSRCRFVGEMLVELDEPLSTEEARTVAEKYGLRWATNSQIDNRRGWLQSAKLIEVTDDRRLVATERGRVLAKQLDLYRPGDGSNAPCKPTEPIEPKDPPTKTTVLAEALAKEVREASIDSASPDRFERAVKEAFAFLGFDSRQLGGSGKTDVLLNAPLSKDKAYRVAVDAKTSGSGKLGDGHITWPTLEDHRDQHNADYSLVVGPSPSGTRLMERAEKFKVAVMSATQLADLCRQHAEAPLGWADYRALFYQRKEGEIVQRGGEVDTSGLDEVAQEAPRMRDLATAVVKVLSERCMILGPLKARELWLIMLERGEVAEGSSDEEVRDLLRMLSHPLVRAVDGSPESGYVLSSKTAVTRMRLQHLADSIAPDIA